MNAHTLCEMDYHNFLVKQHERTTVAALVTSHTGNLHNDLSFHGFQGSISTEHEGIVKIKGFNGQSLTEIPL
jgi:hypothetical protein